MLFFNRFKYCLIVDATLSFPTAGIMSSDLSQEEQEWVSKLEELFAIEPCVFKIEEGGEYTAPSQAQLDKHHKAAISAQVEFLKQKQAKYAGYQNNQELHYSKTFAPLLDIAVNNIGDPWTEGGVRTSTKAAERAVAHFFSRLWRAPQPARLTTVKAGEQLPQGLKEPKTPEFFDEAWACVLSMGSTEGTRSNQTYTT